MLEYGDEYVDDVFYEYLIIPVFKLKNNLNIWERDKKWNDLWFKSKYNLEKYKLFLPQKNLYLSRKINQDNLFKLKFTDFANLINDKFFKKVMIVSSELFTNRKDGSSFMLIRSHILSPDTDQIEVIEEEHQLQQVDDLEFIVNMFIDKTIDEHGKFSEQRAKKVETEVVEIEDDRSKQIMMSVEVFNQEELNIIEKKLAQVKEIDDFKIEHDYDTKYKVMLYVSVSEYELAQGLYLNGLSYKIYGNLYQLIDIKGQGV